MYTHPSAGIFQSEAQYHPTSPRQREPLSHLDSGERLQLTGLQGQVVLVDFYTTDCAPCQPALKNLNGLLERRADAWRGKVTVLAIGLDAVVQPGESAEVVAKHLRRKG